MKVFKRPDFALVLSSPGSRGGVPLAIAFGSGLLMGLTPAPVNAWLLAWVALVPLWVVLFRPAPERRLIHQIACCAAWSAGYHGLALVWITDLHPLTWMGIPWLASVAIALFAWGFITVWGMALVITWFLVLHGLSRLTPRARLVPALRIWLGTALWCGLEYVWSLGPLDWTPLAYTQSPHDLVILHLGQLSGPLTVTAVIVAVNATLAEAWMQQWFWGRPNIARSLVITSAVLWLGSHLLGIALYRQPLNDIANQALTIGIVQGNVPTRIKLFEQGQRLALDRYTQGYEMLARRGVDAVLTPEGALPWVWVGTPSQTQNPFYQTLLRYGIPAWLGSFDYRQGSYTQTLFTLTGEGQVYSTYDKVKLVPLGEYIPFEATLGQLISRLSPLDNSLSPGSTTQIVDTPFGQAIAGICYESAFPQLFRQQAAAGGEFILTASNNDPYKAGMMAQHHAQDVMRAIETDRWAARATNTGFSGIVDPHGHTIWISQFRTYETHAETIFRRQTQTLYVRWGNWLTPVLLLMGGIAWSLEWVSWRRRDKA